ncbi:serine protease grass-like [Macrosteles quadrilineatus]|uniref:serine protease grass-like n=1 Tax=Macrosteles quadrilineatus TaxID=74068 RepID=UPI0023E092EC|nr:serine protease grass-like [Macrosteles quadrilineatus]
MELILGLFIFYFQTIVVFNHNVAGKSNGEQTQTLSIETNNSNDETHLLYTNRSTDGNFTKDVKDMHIFYALERTQDVPVTNSTSLENTKLVHSKVNKTKKIVFNQIKIPSKVVKDGVTTTSKNDMHKATFESDIIQEEPEGSFNNGQNVDIAMHRSGVGHTEGTEFNVNQTEGLHSKPTAYFNEDENLNNLTHPTEKCQFGNNKEQEILHDSQFDSENSEYQDTFDWRRREDSYNLTEPEQYPYSVLLIIRRGGKYSSTCTGSIITEEWVLTAAHCLRGAEELIVYAGGHSKEEYKKFKKGRPLPPTAQLFLSSSFIIHPRYVGGDFDVGLIKVEGKFNFTRAVNSIQLTTTPWKESYHGYTTCVFTGFGVVQVGEKNKDDAYRKTTRLDIKSPCLCSFKLRMLFGSETASRYLCTKPKLDYGVCPGDSGGGLVCGGKVRGVAMQMIKMGNTKYCDLSILGDMQCGGMNTLSVFQDICPFLPWINEHTNVFNGTKISKKCKYSGSARNNNSYGLLFINIVLSVLINSFLR